jgi:hypothetical protein
MIHLILHIKKKKKIHLNILTRVQEFITMDCNFNMCWTEEL